MRGKAFIEQDWIEVSLGGGEGGGGDVIITSMGPDAYAVGPLDDKYSSAGANR